MKSPSYRAFRPSSQRSSAAARAASSKANTTPERRLSAALWGLGLRYRKNSSTLPGKPDLVFPAAKLAVFCDGDFWHGRAWARRRKALAKGANPTYWLRKIQTNIKRDRRVTAALRKDGWTVLRFWESDISRKLESVVQAICASLKATPRPQRHPSFQSLPQRSQ